MIVRINQLDALSRNRSDGWPDDGPGGPIGVEFARGIRAFELAFLETDDARQKSSLEDRQTALRRMLPRLIDAWRAPADWVVLRLDGPLCPDELSRGFSLMLDPKLCERYSFSAADRLDPSFDPPVCSVRMLPAMARLKDIVLDEHLGLHNNVRLRLLSLPEPLVNPFLDTATMDDERWREILPAASFLISTCHGLTAMQVFSRQLNADTIRAQVTSVAEMV